MRLLLILLLSGCGVEPVSQPQAVSDDRAVLGLHPIKQDGTVIYKMMVCKKMTDDDYRPEMFDDDSICRPALLSKTGEEAFFPHDHAHKDRWLLATGLAKGAVVVGSMLALSLIGGKHVLKWLRSLKLRNIDTKTIDKYEDAYQKAQENVVELKELKKSRKKIHKDVTEDQKKYFANYPDRYPVYFIRYKHFKAEQIAKKKLDKATAELAEAKRIEDEIKQLREQISKVNSLREQGGEKLADAQRQLIEIDRQRPLNLSRKLLVAVGAGVTMLTTAVTSKTNNLNWGHGERQLGRYWYQIFYKSGDFSRAQPINELLPVIRAIASTFNYQVNDRALELLRS